jgi:ABC-type bacteriocin/lantibiotic exporter with double-glycine peptidase domain
MSFGSSVVARARLPAHNGGFASNASQIGIGTVGHFLLIRQQIALSTIVAFYTFEGNCMDVFVSAFCLCLLLLG